MPLLKHQLALALVMQAIVMKAVVRAYVKNLCVMGQVLSQSILEILMVHVTQILEMIQAHAIVPGRAA